MQVFIITLILFTYCFTSVKAGDPIFASNPEEISFTQPYKGKVHAFGDIDLDGDCDLITEQNLPDSIYFVLYYNTNNDTFPYFEESSNDLLSTINQQHIKSLRLQDYNLDQRPDVTIITLETDSYYVLGYANTGTAGNPHFSDVSDTLFTLPISSQHPLKLRDFVYYDLINDAIPEVTAVIYRKSFIWDDTTFFKLYEIEDNGTLLEVPDYYGNLSYYSGEVLRIDFIDNSSISYPYLLLNLHNFDSSDEAFTWDSAVLKNSGILQTYWSEVKFLWDTELYFMPGTNTELSSFYYRMNGHGRIESQLHYSNIAITDTSIVFETPRVWKTTGSIDDLCVFDWNSDGYLDLLFFVTQEHNNGLNVGYSHIFYNQCFENFQYNQQVDHYFLAPNFRSYWKEFWPGFFSSYHSMGDLDGDEDTDMFIIRGATSYVVWNIGDDFSPKWSNEEPIYGINVTDSPALIDLNDDGFSDLVARRWEDSTLVLYLNEGNLQQLQFDPNYTELLISTVGRHSALADFDNDGDYDIIHGDKYYRNESIDTTFIFSYSFSIPTIETMSYPVAPLDADRDGDFDLVYFNPYIDTLYILWNQIPYALGDIDNTVPANVYLNQNYPNPFNSETNITLYLPESQEIELSIYNVLGERIRILKKSLVTAGNTRIVWDSVDERGNHVPSGLYFAKLKTSDHIQVRKLLLIK